MTHDRTARHGDPLGSIAAAVSRPATTVRGRYRPRSAPKTSPVLASSADQLQHPDSRPERRAASRRNSTNMLSATRYYLTDHRTDQQRRHPNRPIQRQLPLHRRRRPDRFSSHRLRVPLRAYPPRRPHPQRLPLLRPAARHLDPTRPHQPNPRPRRGESLQLRRGEPPNFIDATGLFSIPDPTKPIKKAAQDAANAVVGAVDAATKAVTPSTCTSAGACCLDCNSANRRRLGGGQHCDRHGHERRLRESDRIAIEH
jgi:hypothetical protein